MALEARSLYHAIQSLDDLDALIAERQEEGLHLEFKGKNHDNDSEGKLSPKDKKSFSKCVSAFANADGGVYILGVHTDPIDGRDVAKELSPFGNYERIAGALRTSIANTTQPSVAGVEIKTIKAKDPTQGFIVAFIPKSFRPPHRSMLCDREYWRRGDGVSHRMEHYEIEDALQLRQKAVLRLTFGLKQHENQEFEVLYFYVANVGRGIAKHFGAALLFQQGTDVYNTVGHLAVNRELNAFPIVECELNQKVIHNHGIRVHLGQVWIRGAHTESSLDLTAVAYAEGIETFRPQLALRIGEIHTYAPSES